MILLDSAYNPGDLDPGVTYTHAKVCKTAFDFNTNRGTAKWCYGTVVDSVFVPGNLPLQPFQVSQEIWTERVEGYTSAGGGEKSHAAWTKALHQLLLDENVVAGTIA